jgi:two-component system, NarL family, response regulator LiaR
VSIKGPIRLLLVEDLNVVRLSVRGFLEKNTNIEVVGEAADGADALALIETLKPTVVLMDIAMPKMDGVTATRFIKATYPHIAVVGLTHNPPSYNVHSMLQAGAFEVVGKDRMFEDLYGAIERAAAFTTDLQDSK